jgi:hypothetical protein
MIFNPYLCVCETTIPNPRTNNNIFIKQPPFAAGISVVFTVIIKKTPR